MLLLHLVRLEKTSKTVVRKEHNNQVSLDGLRPFKYLVWVLSWALLLHLIHLSALFPDNN